MPKLNHVIVGFLVAAVSAGCQSNPDYSETQYRCAADGSCPSGFTCVAGYICEQRQVCGNATLFADDFGGTDIDDDRWNYWTGGADFTVTQANGRVELLAGAPGSDGTMRTRQRYFIEDSVVSMELEFASADAPTPLGLLLRLYINGQNSVTMVHHNDVLRLEHRIANVGFEIASFAFVPELHRWWRLRESKGLIHYETSPNGEQWQIHGTTSSEPFIDKQAAVEVRSWLNVEDQAPASVFVEHINQGIAASSLPWCPGERLSDDFEDGGLGEHWDISRDACEVVEQDGALVFELSGEASSECRSESRAYFDMSKSSVIAEVAAAGGANSIMGMRISSSEGNSMEFSLSESTLTMSETLGGVSARLGDLAFQTDAHRFWRLRGEGGSIFWEASADGESFTELARHKDIGVELDEMTVTLWARSVSGSAQQPYPAFATVNPVPDALAPESAPDAGTSP